MLLALEITLSYENCVGKIIFILITTRKCRSTVTQQQKVFGYANRFRV